MIEKERIKYLNDKKATNKDYVLYWMQNAQRINNNHALSYAIKRANDFNQKLVVYFGLDINFKEANYRHFYFMLEGLKEVYEEFNKMGVEFILLKEKPDEGAIKMAQNASFVVVDKGYLNYEKNMRSNLNNNINCPLVEVETNVIVPVEEVSNKQEYAAYTIRKKVMSKVDFFAKEISNDNLLVKSMSNIDFNDLFDYIKKSEFIDLALFRGGYSNALKTLDNFVSKKMEDYSELRNDPSLDFQSDLSPYLHFGQISPIEIYLKTINNSTFIEELVVRRELAFNFVYYNFNYDNYKCLPKWALDTLDLHKLDQREHVYSLLDLEFAKTHDDAWNACQTEMVKTGKMHGYMRMYWGKKVIEWSSTPEQAFYNLIYLNNKYNLDGRDPNSFSGIAWCFGLHDRPWTERSIFGIIRYMNYAGLKRKFKIDNYINKWGKL